MWDKHLRWIGLLVATWLLAADTPGEYRYPMDGFYLLSGTFGELRPNHFHSGIDITTNQRTGFAVYAAQDGYVYRLKVSPFGFGNAVYLKHPDGNFTVYAHLNGFTPALETYVRSRQQAEHQYVQEIYLEPQEIRVARGEMIGYSGNSGSSNGPHLHFEIRDSLERIMNPLRWYPTRFQDHRPPRLDRVAFEPMTDSSRVKGKFRKWGVLPLGTPGKYVLAGTVEINGPVGLEYLGTDLLDGTSSPCGIDKARLYLDENLIFSRNLTRFDFEETRLIHVHFDYPRYLNQRDRMERAYREPGNVFPALDESPGPGFIHLTDDREHTFRLELEDFHGNKTLLSGNLKRGVQIKMPSTAAYRAGTSSFQLSRKRNVLVVAAIKPGPQVVSDGLVWESNSGEKRAWKPAYRSGDTLFFIQNLATAPLPLRIATPDKTWKYDSFFHGWIIAGKAMGFDKPEGSVFFPVQGIFADYLFSWKILPRTGAALVPIQDIGDGNEPLWHSFQVALNPPLNVDTSCLVVAYRGSASKSWEYAGSGCNSRGQVTAEWNAFGQFTLLADSAGPEVLPINFTTTQPVPGSLTTLTWKAKDAFAGVDAPRVHFRIDGIWIPVAYNYKTQTLSWKIEQRPGPGKHTLRAEVGDKAGNYTIREWVTTW